MNRREFFKMIFGAGAACVLPGVVKAIPKTAFESQCPRTAKYLAELQAWQSMALTWGSTPIYFDPGFTPDETAVVMLNNNGTVAGVIHNIGN